MARKVTEAYEPDPLLASSEGDEAVILAERDSRKKWLGVAAGVGVASVVAAATMLWGQKEEKPNTAPPSARRKRPKSKAAAHAPRKGEEAGE